MPFLKQQIEIVNNQLTRLALADKRFSAGRYEAIAVDCSRTETDGSISYFPGVMSENYEAQEITANDTYPIIIYHKELSPSYTLNDAQFGDRQKLVVETVSMKMVVYAKYSAVKMTREQLEALITTNFPDQLPSSTYRPLKFDNLTVILQRSNMNSAAVWNEEYKGTPLRLAPEDIYFSIYYQIQSNYRKGCFSICDCPNYLLTENSEPIEAQNGDKIRV